MLSRLLRPIQGSRRSIIQICANMATAKLKPNVDGSSLDHDDYFPSVDAVPRQIVALDTNLCLINKPPHVRMSGNFTVTVEKLLLHWFKGSEVKDFKWVHQLDYGTSGILCVGLNRKAAGLASCSFASRVVKKQYLAVLQGHVDISAYPIVDNAEPLNEKDLQDDDESGSSLTKRKSLDNNSGAPSKPKGPKHDPNEKSWQNEVMEANLQVCWQALQKWRQENADRTNSFNDANSGNLPAAHPDNSTQEDSGADSTSNTLTFTTFAAQNPAAWSIGNTIVNFTLDQFRRAPQPRKILRKFLKACNIDVAVQESHHNACPDLMAEKEKAKDEAVNAVTTEFEVTATTVQALREKYLSLPFGSGVDEPAVFRAPRDVPGGYRLVIRIPVAEIPGDFRMEPGHDGNPGKVCETELEILQYGSYKGKEVTKVRLHPRTGRRHQLRVHTMCLGHPIVGDFTYNPVHRDAVLVANPGRDAAVLAVAGDHPGGHHSDAGGEAGVYAASNKTCAESNASLIDGADASQRDIAVRMMLHAHRLRINYYEGSGKLPAPSQNPRMAALIAQNFPPDSPFLLHDQPATQSALAQQAPDVFVAPGTEDAQRVLVQAGTEDPFVFVEGELQPTL